MWRSNQLSYRTDWFNLRQDAPGVCRFPLLFLDKQLSGTRDVNRTSSANRSRKEVFQPHLPVRLPCYDLAPITGFTLGRSSRSRTSGTPGFHGLTGGVYKARERIHRAVGAITSESSFVESGCRLQSELRGAFRIGIPSPGSGLLYPPL